MALSKRKFVLIVILLVISLGGLMTLQFYLLNYAMQQKERAFDRNVSAAMQATVRKLEQLEIERSALAFDEIGGDSLEHKVTMNVVMMTDDSIPLPEKNWIDSLDKVHNRVWVENDQVVYNVKSTQHVRLQAYDPDKQVSVILVDTIKQPGEYKLEMPFKEFESNSYYYRFQSDSNTFMFQAGDDFEPSFFRLPSDTLQKRKMIAGIVNRLTVAEWQPIAERIDSQKLHTALSSSLKESGINLEPAYAVIEQGTDSMPIIRPADYKNELQKSGFQAELFPNDIFPTGAQLALFFPGRQAFLWKQMIPLLAASIGFMLIIVGCFAVTIHSVVSQKRFAGLMTDFINNMTHEFKTPISTIALASEAIGKSGDDKTERIERYNQMIRDENNRMRHQVDKILQMAVLEEGDYELNLSRVDMHELIHKAIRNFDLQIEARGGRIATELNAARHIVSADIIHMENIIHNLLDNAVKYSPQVPQIKIFTADKNDHIEVKVADQGIGMDARDCRQAFDKYYRVSSGNLHNVKGFGLGLSYVKLMVEAHNGTVSLESREGQGTVVSITLPNVNAESSRDGV